MRNRCCKPFFKGSCSKKLKNVSPSFRKKLGKFLSSSQLKVANSLCSSCSFKLQGLSIDNLPLVEKVENMEVDNLQIIEPAEDVKIQGETREDLNDIENVDRENKTDLKEKKSSRVLVIENLNKSILPLLQTSPISFRQLRRNQNYIQSKSKEITTVMKNVLHMENDLNLQEQSEQQKQLEYYKEIIQQIQADFLKAENFNEKIQVIKRLPISMGPKEIFDILGPTVSRYMINLAKKNLQFNNEMQQQSLIRGKKSISNEVIKRVQNFYLNDTISRELPGKNDCIRVFENGERKTKQKRLMLLSVNEAYELFKIEHSELKIGKTKFHEIRPKNCIKLGPSTTHTVCVCIIHQNVKLMMENGKIAFATRKKLQTYKDCINLVICSNPEDACYTLRCKKCPGLSVLQSLIENSFEESGITEVKYKQWKNTDRCNLESVIDIVQDFIKKFLEKIKILIPHDFINHQQSIFIKNCKEQLKEGEFLVQCDFAENYAFIIQNSVQGFHWNNNQATIHPFVIYYRDDENILQHLSFVNISDCNEHNSISVYLFISKMIAFLKTKFQIINKISYLSDGAGAQYKNK